MFKVHVVMWRILYQQLWKKFSKNSWKEAKCFEKLQSQNLQLYLKWCTLWLIQKQLFKGVPKKRCSENMQQIHRRTPMPECNFNKVGKELYWNHTSAWVFSHKSAAYFQNTFSQEHLWTADSTNLFAFCWVFFWGNGLVV